MHTPTPDYAFDPHDPQFARDPWSVYRELRERCPVAYSDTYDGGFWVLSKYADVRTVALDPAHFSSAGDLLLPANHDAGWLLPIQSDPPATVAYRRLLGHVFNARAVGAIEPLVRTWTIGAVEAFAERGHCDFVPELAHPIPGKTTMQLMGWPVDEWADVVVAIKELTTRAPGDPDRARAAGDVDRIRHRVVENLAQRRSEPGDDLASALLAGSIDSRPLSDDEMVALMMLVVFGGIDTTVAAIGNMLTTLDAHPELRQRLLLDDRLIPVFVEEVLRYEPPIQGFARFPTGPAEIAGHEISEDSKVFLIWASANRDDEVFPDPDAVRLDRHSNPHLAFGVGAHKCLGATLARMELRVVLEEVLRRIPDYTLVRDEIVPPRTAGTVFERLALPAVFTPARSEA
jgi:cytochrome P450